MQKPVRFSQKLLKFTQELLVMFVTFRMSGEAIGVAQFFQLRGRLQNNNLKNPSVKWDRILTKKYF